MPVFSRFALLNAWEALIGRLRGIGQLIPPLILRLIMGWEFYESGREKLGGSNWFADVQDRFPVPFNVVPVDFSWTIATWFELIGGIALMIGLGTRFFAFSLLFLTFVATAAVHWPDMWTMASDLLKGYAVTDSGHGNFKLPLLFVVMLLPLLFQGPGKLSIDYVIAKALGADTMPQAVTDAYAWALMCVVLGLPFLMLIPTFGIALLLLGVVLAAFGRYARA